MSSESRAISLVSVWFTRSSEEEEDLDVLLDEDLDVLLDEDLEAARAS